MPESQKSIALITGASSGIGEEFALQLCSEPHLNEMWLVARRVDRLESLAKKLKEKNPRMEVRILPIDLIQPQEIETKLNELLKKENPQIRWCINNAGFGLVGDFEDLDLSKQLEMIDLNVRAATHISGITLPFLKSGSHLILTASAAGFFPLPTFAVYAATKAYVVNFANALANELQPKGIHVTAVCPGPVETEFLAVAYSSNQPNVQLIDDVSHHKLTTFSAQEVVQQAIKDSKKAKIRSTKGKWIDLIVRTSGLIPRQLLLTSLGNALRKKK